MPSLPRARIGLLIVGLGIIAAPLDTAVNIAFPSIQRDFAGEFFALSFGRQVGVVRDLPCFLFDLTFHFMELAFDLVSRTRLHLFSPDFSLSSHRNYFSGPLNNLDCGDQGDAR